MPCLNKVNVVVTKVLEIMQGATDNHRRYFKIAHVADFSHITSCHEIVGSLEVIKNDVLLERDPQHGSYYGRER